ncbi:copper-binding protein [Pedomonas mirosovicensis]|uniref:copper-binding protein n=1 Tax=Pedomonas mirosovicensis TaxID=2908641 RepID=UPI00216A2DA6|nr:copper-binding protein [Pedomonas mirosovicensis]MCH8686765.1 copper-binding protein [Pedomonas mirosovicensis]
MKRSILMCVTAASLGLTGLGLMACGQAEEAENATATSLSTDQPEDDKTYAATGTITAIAGNQVTIAHGPVKDLDWPAQTADFQAQNLDQIINLRPGDKVSFTFNQAGGQYILVSIQKRGD